MGDRMDIHIKKSVVNLTQEEKVRFFSQVFKKESENIVREKMKDIAKTIKKYCSGDPIVCLEKIQQAISLENLREVAKKMVLFIKKKMTYIKNKMGNQVGVLKEKVRSLSFMLQLDHEQKFVI